MLLKGLNQLSSWKEFLYYFLTSPLRSCVVLWDALLLTFLLISVLQFGYLIVIFDKNMWRQVHKLYRCTLWLHYTYFDNSRFKAFLVKNSNKFGLVQCYLVGVGLDKSCQRKNIRTFADKMCFGRHSIFGMDRVHRVKPSVIFWSRSITFYGKNYVDNKLIMRTST